MEASLLSPIIIQQGFHCPLVNPASHVLIYHAFPTIVKVSRDQQILSSRNSRFSRRCLDYMTHAENRAEPRIKPELNLQGYWHDRYIDGLSILTLPEIQHGNKLCCRNSANFQCRRHNSLGSTGLSGAREAQKWDTLDSSSHSLQGFIRFMTIIRHIGDSKCASIYGKVLAVPRSFTDPSTWTK